MKPDIEDEDEPPMLVDVGTLTPAPSSESVKNPPKLANNDLVVNRVPITIVTGNCGHYISIYN